MRSSSAELTAESGSLTDRSFAAMSDLGEVGAAVRRAVQGATDIAAATEQFTSAIGEASTSTRRSADLSAGAAPQSTVLTGRMTRVQDCAQEI